MTAVCQFCNREFSSAQAVKAHLKACRVYRAQRGANQAPKARPLGDAVPPGAGQQQPPSPGGPSKSGFDRVGKLEEEVATRRLRMTLREMDEAEADLDRQAAAKDREQARAAEEQAEQDRRAAEKRNAERERAEQARQAQELKEAAQRERRERIQSIKKAVVGEWYAKPLGLPNLDDAVYHAIENAFEGLTLDELSDPELTAIAKAARDRVYRKAKQELDATEAAEREVEEEERQIAEEERKLAERKQRLIERAVTFTERELKNVDGLPLFGSYEIKHRVQSELQQDLVGDETWDDVEDIIWDVLAAEGIELD